ncbi:50S ribosomal protein L18 [Candidatus Bathyarchaeota archaeon]|nr:MAG: 50S ribosomal protein L18 [Candidatus Bathyarchaeota archaeon]
MARGPSYNVPYRRRIEGKTDYHRRKKLLISGLPRLVARKTNKHIVAQIVEASIEGDRVLASAHSSELRKKFGWLGSLKNLPAAYLTGLLCGYRALKRNVKKAILDIGLQTPSKGARVFAVMKGCIDAGIEIPHGEEILPSDERIEGQHISDYASTLSSTPEVYSKRFSEYLSRGLRPENIVENFSVVKKKIETEFKE